MEPITHTQKEDIDVNCIDLADDIDIDDFQVVRREFFSHINEPSITFNNCKFNVNTACLSKFPEFNYAQILVNQKKKILAVLPCDETAKDSYMWCKTYKGRKQPKTITCRLFFAKIVSMMGWNPEYKHKIMGKVVHANDKYMIAFDLNATETYERIKADGTKPKTSKVPVYPADWQNQFGMPFKEHRQSMQIDLFDGYAVFAVKDNELSDTTKTVANDQGGYNE